MQKHIIHDHDVLICIILVASDVYTNLSSSILYDCELKTRCKCPLITKLSMMIHSVTIHDETMRLSQIIYVYAFHSYPIILASNGLGITSDYFHISVFILLVCSKEA